MINGTLIYHELSPDSICITMLQINSLRCSSPFIFDMFLEKNKLKDVSSNDADQLRDLRVILIAAHKYYVLDAPLGDKTVVVAYADVMNV